MLSRLALVAGTFVADAKFRQGHFIFCCDMMTRVVYFSATLKSKMRQYRGLAQKLLSLLLMKFMNITQNCSSTEFPNSSGVRSTSTGISRALNSSKAIQNGVHLLPEQYSIHKLKILHYPIWQTKSFTPAYMFFGALNFLTAYKLGAGYFEWNLRSYMIICCLVQCFFLTEVGIFLVSHLLWNKCFFV